jgi:flagellar hook assembly protein FlgD
VSVKQNESTVSDYKLFNNYPNPFNPKTTIKYKTKGPSHVNLTVYDILGRKVKVLVNEIKQQGTHSINFDASELSSGTYYYQLKSEDFIKTKKLLLTK